MKFAKTQNGTEYLAEPIGAKELEELAAQHEEGLLSVCVGVSLNDVAMTDYEGYLDLVEREIVKDYEACLSDICIAPVDVDAATGRVIVRVTSDFDAI